MLSDHIKLFYIKWSVSRLSFLVYWSVGVLQIWVSTMLFEFLYLYNRFWYLVTLMLSCYFSFPNCLGYPYIFILQMHVKRILSITPVPSPNMNFKGKLIKLIYGVILKTISQIALVFLNLLFGIIRCHLWTGKVVQIFNYINAVPNT